MANRWFAKPAEKGEQYRKDCKQSSILKITQCGLWIRNCRSVVRDLVWGLIFTTYGRVKIRLGVFAGQIRSLEGGDSFHRPTPK